jgi:peptidyl-prolyl cis-trans isomerase C
MLCGLAIAGCARDSSDSVTRRRDARPVADVVARVGDRAIGLSDVQARMKADRIGPEAALQELVDEEVLLQEAIRQGFTQDPEDERAAERLMVRAMLHDIEREITPESISEREVREDFAAHADKLQLPERRRSWHILVRDPSEAGRALAQSILEEVRAAEDPRAVFERHAQEPEEKYPIPVKAEELPAITAKAKMERPYLDALFAAESTGPLKRLVKTSYGWHALFVEEIIPAERKTILEVEGEIRERLSQKKRFERIVSIVEKLRAQGLVEYDEEGVEQLMSMTGLPERTE